MKRLKPRLDLGIFLRFYLVIIAIIVMLFLIKTSQDSPILDVLKSVLGIFFISFLPGYLLVHFFIEKNLQRFENFILSVCMSICITIISGITVHFAGLKITFFNIMGIVLTITLLFTILIFFKDYVYVKKIERDEA